MKTAGPFTKQPFTFTRTQDLPKKKKEKALSDKSPNKERALKSPAKNPEDTKNFEVVK